MKKLVIIVLVFAALVFGSCGELQKGGKIKVKNESPDFSVNVYITKSMGDLTPPTDWVAKKTINANATGEISINNDGTYYVKPFFNIANHEVPGTVDPFLPVILGVGNTVSVKVKMIVE
jgi:hypothetical protein